MKKLKPRTIKLLRKVARHILEEPKRFEMDRWGMADHRVPCNTTACFAGWAIILGDANPKRFFKAAASDAQDDRGRFMALLEGRVGASARAEKVLGITNEQARRLFHVDSLFHGDGRGWPEPYRGDFDHATSREHAAEIAVARIEHFIKTGGAE